MTTETQLAQAFEQQRHRLSALAYRVLGSGSDAEDAVRRRGCGCLVRTSMRSTTCRGG